MSLQDFAHEYKRGQGLHGWAESLPNILAVQSLKELVAAIVVARRDGKRIIWGLGGHVIKCGLAPVLLGLMREGFADAFALNGSAAIHDAEIALAGSTSEEVEDVLGSGVFGMADDTGRLLRAGFASCINANPAIKIPKIHFKRFFTKIRG